MLDLGDKNSTVDLVFVSDLPSQTAKHKTHSFLYPIWPPYQKAFVTIWSGKTYFLLNDGFGTRNDHESPKGRFVGFAKRHGGGGGEETHLERSGNNPRQTTTDMCNTSSDRPPREPDTDMSELPPSGTWPVYRLIA